MDGTSYNAWRLTSLSTLPGWAIALACAGLCAALWLSFRGIRAEPSALRRRVLIALRATAALLLFVLLLEPGVELRAESRVRARIALLLDTSRSMRFPAAPNGPSRAEAMLGWLKARLPDLSVLAARFQVDVYGFDKEVQPQDADKLAASVAQADQVAQGPATDIVGALTSAAAAGTGGRPLAGLVVASDGADNAELVEGMTPQATTELQKLGAPVFALPVGAQAVKDLAIDKVVVDDFAFVRNQVTVDVTVSARGFPATDVPVVVKREGQIVAQKTVHVGSGVQRAETKLSFIPDRTGKFAFEVAAPVYEGEALAQNNSRSFVLKVIRDRVRVVLVVGRPSWDVRFLRQLLKRDPNVDLISFFILRTPGDDTRSSQDELSLIPFPTQEIFQEQLKTFDLVIFQDFGNRPWYHLSQYLDGIANYVREGGALAVIGGEQALSASDFGGTAIDSILPVNLTLSGPPVDETPAQVRLTEAGKRHPMTELVPGLTANEHAWARLPQLPGLNSVASVKDDSQTLLVSQDGRPVLVVGEVGRGRTLALTTDASWYWSFVAAGQELGPRAYETFWHSAIRWLVRDPALTPMRVAAEKTSFDPAGELPALDVQVRGSDYGAAAGAQLKAQLSSADDATQRPAGQAVAGPDGTARLTLPQLPPGAYKAVVTAKRPDGAPVGEAEEAFVVQPSGAEMLQPAPRPDLLRAIADVTRGKLIEDGDRLDALPFRDPQRVEVGQRKSRPLWDRWGVLAALCCIVGAEWTLRRRWGYA
ncbi:MAG TPA: glutamine amidotransferase [Myxococcales bacterium]|nr:glutamine amidotransferase [Myxococcales bacterium]